MLGPVQVLIVGVTDPESARSVLGSLVALAPDGPVGCVDAFECVVHDDGELTITTPRRAPATVASALRGGSRRGRSCHRGRGDMAPRRGRATRRTRGGRAPRAPLGRGDPRHPAGRGRDPAPRGLARRRGPVQPRVLPLEGRDLTADREPAAATSVRRIRIASCPPGSPSRFAGADAAHQPDPPPALATSGPSPGPRRPALDTARSRQRGRFTNGHAVAGPASVQARLASMASMSRTAKRWWCHSSSKITRRQSRTLGCHSPPHGLARVAASSSAVTAPR